MAFTHPNLYNPNDENKLKWLISALSRRFRYCRRELIKENGAKSERHSVVPACHWVPDRIDSESHLEQTTDYASKSYNENLLVLNADYNCGDAAENTYRDLFDWLQAIEDRLMLFLFGPSSVVRVSSLIKNLPCLQNKYLSFDVGKMATKHQLQCDNFLMPEIYAKCTKLLRFAFATLLDMPFDENAPFANCYFDRAVWELQNHFA